MSRETEILSALETQSFALSQIIGLLESINDKLGDTDTGLVGSINGKLGDIDRNLDALTGFGTDTIGDLKDGMDNLKDSVERLISQ